MRKFNYIFILLILLIISISTLVLNDYLPSANVSKIIEIINVTQVFISVYIAYLLYDRFGTSKKILDKQNDIVIEYLEELKKIKLFMYIFTEERTVNFIPIYASKRIKFLVDDNSKNKRIMVKSGFYYGKTNRLNEIINHPLFPIDIKNDLNIFTYQNLTRDFNFDQKKCVFLSFEEETDLSENNFNENNWMILDDRSSLTIREYFHKIENLIKAVENWVNKESSIKIKLNFE